MNTMKHHKRIVIKIGSQLVVKTIALDRLYLTEICREIAFLLKKQWQPLIVLSGAVATGKQHLPLYTKHAQAAYGQSYLTAAITQAAEEIKLPIAQLLLTRDDILQREHYSTTRATLEELITKGVIPIINENDATTLKGRSAFEDNDQLATIIALMMEADRLLLLTSVAGVFSSDPDNNRGAELIRKIANINLEIIRRIGRGKTTLGRGGMAGKLKAARLATAVGIATCIADGRNPRSLSKIVLQDCIQGTLCLPRSLKSDPLSERERWILSAQNTGASIQLDAGAVEAIKNRRSLLAVGVKKIFGHFTHNECVELLDPHHETIALGLTKLSSRELAQLLKSAKKPFNIEVVHADNLRILE